MAKKMSDKELEDFVKANRERIEKLLNEEGSDFLDIAEETVIKGAKKARKKTEELKGDKSETVKENAKEFAKAVFDPEVQKHFMRMGMEFVLGMSAFFDAIPKPDFVEDVAKDAKETQAEISKEFCDANPNCVRKKKPSVKKIELD